MNKEIGLAHNCQRK